MKLKILLPFLLLTFISCSGNKNNKLFVSAEGGLKMRSEASLDASKVTTIPNNSEVTLLEEVGDAIEIGGKTGKWTKVKYQDNEGWVFGGFLVKNESVTESKEPINPSWAKPIVGMWNKNNNIFVIYESGNLAYAGCEGGNELIIKSSITEGDKVTLVGSMGSNEASESVFTLYLENEKLYINDSAYNKISNKPDDYNAVNKICGY